MPESLLPEELQAILTAAKALNIDPTTLTAANPFDAEYAKTSTGQAIRMQISQADPAMAAQLTKKSGHKQSLAVAAFNAGIVEKTQAIHKELMETDPTYVKLHAESTRLNEERILAEMEAAANKSWEQRTGLPADERDRPSFALYGNKFKTVMEQRWIQDKLMSDD